MRSLEDRLRPPYLSAPWPRDLLGIALLVAMAAVLLPIWGATGERYLPDVPGQLASIYLLPALGFCLALRCGAIDLSVWSCAGLGGVVVAALHNEGFPLGGAIAAGISAGLVCGAINGLLVAKWRLPSIVVTFATALTIVWIAGAGSDSRTINLPEGTFEGWHLTLLHVMPDQKQGEAPAAETAQALPLPVTRMLIVAGLWAITLLVLLAAEIASRHGFRVGGGWTLFAAMCASGGLSAAGGMLWLIDRNAAPIPTRPVGDLRVVAAAILAGGAFLGGRGRGLLAAGLCLPPALLMATIWRQEVCNLQRHGYELQTALLIGMVILTHAGMAAAVAGRRPGRRLAVASTALTATGILTLAATPAIGRYTTRGVFQAAGLLSWLTGAVLLLVARGLAGRARRGRQ